MKRSSKKVIRSKENLERRLEFLYGLHEAGVELNLTDVQLLKNNGFIKTPRAKKIDKKRQHAIFRADKKSKSRGAGRDYSIKDKTEQAADKHIDIIREEDDVNYEGSVVEENEYERMIQKSHYKYVGKEITKEDWKPPMADAGIITYDPDFVKWIDSINAGFGSKKSYAPFNKYCQQAMQWLADNDSIANYIGIDEQVAFARKEKQRCTDNSLYFLNRYLVLKEGNIEGGGRQFKAWECQAIICYLFDLGYSYMVGKPRQIGATSTIGALFVKRIVFGKSYFVKFITETLEKGEEIFDDKIKHAFYHLPDFLKPTVNNDRDNLLRLFYKPKKGDVGGVDSKLQVTAPQVTAINGGAPNLVGIDEAGNINILSEMMNEGRPALFWINPETGNMEMKRQLVVWGTGGEMDRGGKAFEREFRSATEAWAQRDFHYGIVPVFFDCFSKPGLTEEFYNKEKLFYEKQGMDNEKSLVQFHQHYPTCIDDMFLTSSDTLIPMETITVNINRIRKMPDKERPVHGYFEPDLDENKPMPGSTDVPFMIRGARFIPTAEDDKRASCIIFKHPDKNWANRYYQGTDPIFSESGHSKMASGIWDNLANTISAIVNCRFDDYRYNYMQAMLLGLYYDQNNCRNLIESNVGSGFMDYIDAKGYWRTIVPNNMIHAHMQTPSGGKMGIGKRANTAKFILHKLQELCEVYAPNIWIEEFFVQLKTYVRKVTAAGNESFKVENAKYYYDDIIDAVTYSYICGQSFSHLEPYEKDKRKAKKTKYRYAYDDSFNLTLKKVREGDDEVGDGTGRRGIQRF